MKNTITYLSILSFILFSCNTPKTATSNNVDDGNKPKKEEVSKENENNATENTTEEATKEKVADSLFATIRKTPCLGRCPAYEMKIYKSGYATFDGKSSVKKEGLYAKHFSTTVLDSIKSLALKIGYFELKSEYRGKYVVDIPSTYTSLQMKGKYKKIDGTWKIPVGLQHFQRYLHELSQTDGWEKVEGKENSRREK